MINEGTELCAEVTKFMNIDCFTDESQAKDMIKLLDEFSQDNKNLDLSERLYRSP